MPALRTASALATLLRAFAVSDSDLLWTPLPVDPERMAPVEELPCPELVSGPLPPISGTVRWGDPGEIAASVNHRRFALETATELGSALPGSRMMESLGALRDHLDSGGASGSPDGSWVAKAPWSAAGRLRVFGQGREIEVEEARRLESLFEEYGELLFEPWMRRTADFGVSGEVGEGTVNLNPAHRQIVDDRGRFLGITVNGVHRDLNRELRAAAWFAGERLREAGYRGPFGTDAWEYEGRDGKTQLNPLGELNARMTFGRVARRLATRLGLPSPGKLRVGSGPPPEEAIPLLLPGDEDRTSAWFEPPER